MTHPFGSCYEDEKRSVPSRMPAILSPSLETPPVQGRRHTLPTKMQCRVKSLQPRKVKQSCVPREESRINFDQGARGAEGVRESWTLEKQDFDREKGSRIRAKAQVWTASVSARATITTHHRPGGLETTEMYC